MAYKHEEVKPYSNEGKKREQVEAMFDNIANEYDRFNYLASFNIDRIWRKRAISSLKPFAPRNVLDIATGTGDLALLIENILKPESIIGCDISEGMMQVAREKCRRRGITNIRFEKEDCTALSYPDNSFDALTSSFGVRNFQELEKALGIYDGDDDDADGSNEEKSENTDTPPVKNADEESKNKDKDDSDNSYHW
jgi:demethylmenaquinone methyltransferase/2-methoxy-6-polyprenyl-1,4-benzoquinol methylase